jgi:hypothetical protein
MSANRKLANAFAAQASKRTLAHERGQVTAVNATTPPTVTVAVSGGTSTITCRYVRGSSPAVGDSCEILRAGRTKFAVFLA